MINKKIYELMEKQRKEEFRKYFEECVKEHNKWCYSFYDSIDPYYFYKIVKDDNIPICCNCRMFIEPYDFIFPKNICMNCLKGDYDIYEEKEPDEPEIIIDFNDDEPYLGDVARRLCVASEN